MLTSMNASTIITAAVLALLCAIAASGVISRLKNGSSCCGTRSPKMKKAEVADKDKSHYPFSYRITIGGMKCASCAARVENALNKTSGTFAEVSLPDNSARILSKTERTAEDFSKTISAAGYSLESFST